VRSFAGAGDLTRAQLRDAPVHRPRPSALDVSIEALEGVGPRLAEAAVEAGIATIGDLLLRFPHSHRDRTVVPVGDLEPKAQATIRVEVLGNAPRPFRKRGLTILGVKVGDESGAVRATWFNQPWVAPKLTKGTQLLLTGSLDKRGFRVSEYEFVASGPRVPSQGEGALRAGHGPSSPPLTLRHPQERRQN
jgi:ATP-dependent DNA helicase RecG